MRVFTQKMRICAYVRELTGRILQSYYIHDMEGPLQGADAARLRTDSMIPSLYDSLRHLAEKKLSNEASGQTLSATALVHEAYLSLRSDNPQWDNKGHFYVAAAEAMRRILIGRARRRNAQKRGDGVKPLPLADDSIHAPMSPVRSEELLALDEALEKLGQSDPRKVELVNLRYFVGLSLEEAAQALSISVATASRDWSYARAWLGRELSTPSD
jgi:RNA polymerase sigma factor (TIGR02999 family)